MTNSELENALKPNYYGVSTVLMIFGITSHFTMARETLGVPIVEDLYGTSPSKAATYVSVTVAAGNLISVVFMLLTLKPFKRIDTRKVMIWGGFFVMCISILLHFPFSDKDIPIANCTNVANTSFQKTLSRHQNPFLTAVRHFKLNVSADITSSEATAFEDENCYGCPYEQQPWCETANLITAPQLIVTYFVGRIGINNVVSTAPTVYSKIFGPVPMGVWMSLLSVVSGLSRLTGPLFLSYIYEKSGPVILYAVLFGLQSFAFVLGLIFFNSMAPMQPDGSELKRNGDKDVSNGKDKSNSSQS